jgi:uncharacterized membrane protein
MSAAAVADPLPPPVTPARLDTIDVLRGIAMVLMALDHSRDWFSSATVNPVDLTQTWPALFFTRWITHYCAPAFVFLAGASAYLYGSRGRTKRELSRFLLTRGLWLIFLELTMVRFGWYFSFDYHYIGDAQVIWAIGWCMVVLSALVYLPVRYVAAIGIAITLFHNLLDGIAAKSLDGWASLWMFVHERGVVQPAPGYTLSLAYPILSWIGIMAAGYGFGTFFRIDPRLRRKLFLTIGPAMIVLFLVLRFSNVYGDMSKWAVQKDALFTLMSFLNITKYPPSLLYALMTLGPAITFLGLWKKEPGALARPFVIFGRVPLFYYLLHLFVLHSLAIVYSWFTFGSARWLFEIPATVDSNFGSAPKDYGVGLPMVYVFWIAALLILYLPCKWFAGVKQRHRNVWLSYL